MVCDMVEQPRCVAERMATWLREGWCRQAIFNLKLPMKKRWDDTRLCLDLVAEQAGRPLAIRARQLYHDHVELTVFAAVAGRAPIQRLSCVVDAGILPLVLACRGPPSPDLNIPPFPPPSHLAVTPDRHSA